jgi:hypothetical protein
VGIPAWPAVALGCAATVRNRIRSCGSTGRNRGGAHRISGRGCRSPIPSVKSWIRVSGASAPRPFGGSMRDPAALSKREVREGNVKAGPGEPAFPGPSERLPYGLVMFTETMFDAGAAVVKLPEGLRATQTWKVPGTPELLQLTVEEPHPSAPTGKASTQYA